MFHIILSINILIYVMLWLNHKVFIIYNVNMMEHKILLHKYSALFNGADTNECYTCFNKFICN